ncbi:MAG: hypothetical protein D6770_01735 [Anaerolineae bacterium]|nr:MAG: hypothetical protein D6770_01735 [Anaerolineae bacterium]
MTYEEDVGYEPAPPEEASNRTFLIAAGVLGGIVFLSIACLAVYALLILPRQRATQQAQQATIVAQNTQVAQALTGTALASTPLPSPVPTDTPSPSPTPVVAVPTDTPTPVATDTPDPATATVAAALTEAAIAAQTVIPTSTALPGTGFAEDFGIPGLLILAVALVVVVFLARRLRSAPVS